MRNCEEPSPQDVSYGLLSRNIQLRRPCSKISIRSKTTVFGRKRCRAYGWKDHNWHTEGSCTQESKSLSILPSNFSTIKTLLQVMLNICWFPGGLSLLAVTLSHTQFIIFFIILHVGVQKSRNDVTFFIQFLTTITISSSLYGLMKYT